MWMSHFGTVMAWNFHSIRLIPAKPCNSTLKNHFAANTTLHSSIHSFIHWTPSIGAVIENGMAAIRSCWQLNTITSRRKMSWEAHRIRWYMYMRGRYLVIAVHQMGKFECVAFGLGNWKTFNNNWLVCSVVTCKRHTHTHTYPISMQLNIKNSHFPKYRAAGFVCDFFALGSHSYILLGFHQCSLCNRDRYFTCIRTTWFL